MDDSFNITGHTDVSIIIQTDSRWSTGAMESQTSRWFAKIYRGMGEKLYTVICFLCYSTKLYLNLIM